jgi:ABC-type branched-subunit amino acid transport system substrate-binding protein
VRRDFSRYLKKPLASSAAAMLFAAFLAACGSSKAPVASATPAGPITIGVSLSLTGSSANDFSADGRAFERGYELWAKDVNAHGGRCAGCGPGPWTSPPCSCRNASGSSVRP